MRLRAIRVRKEIEDELVSKITAVDLSEDAYRTIHENFRLNQLGTANQTRTARYEYYREMPIGSCTVVSSIPYTT